jgi:hypothetical protein
MRSPPLRRSTAEFCHAGRRSDTTRHSDGSPAAHACVSARGWGSDKVAHTAAHLASHVDLRAAIQQQLRHVQVALLRRPRQRRLAMLYAAAVRAAGKPQRTQAAATSGSWQQCAHCRVTALLVCPLVERRASLHDVATPRRVEQNCVGVEYATHVSAQAHGARPWGAPPGAGRARSGHEAPSQCAALPAARVRPPRRSSVQLWHEPSRVPTDVAERARRALAPRRGSAAQAAAARDAAAHRCDGARWKVSPGGRLLAVCWLAWLWNSWHLGP